MLPPPPEKRDQPLETGRAPELSVVNVVLALLIAFAALWLYRAFPKADLDEDSPWGFIIGFLLGMPIAVLVHEIGHAVFGTLGGYQWRVLAFGPAQLTRSLAGWQISRIRGLRAFGGLAMMTAARPFADTRAGTALYTAGGIIANLLQAWLFWHWSLSAEPWLAGALWMSAAIALAVAFINVVPSFDGGVASDGAHLLSLLAGAREMQVMAAINQVHAQSMAGVAPIDLPLEPVIALLRDDAKQDKHDDLGESLRLFLYAQAYQRGEIEAARSELEIALKEFAFMPAGLRQGLALQAAIFLLIEFSDPENDLARAKAWIAAGEGGIVDPLERALAKALADCRDSEKLTPMPWQQLLGLSNRSSSLGWSRFLEFEVNRARVRIGHE